MTQSYSAGMANSNLRTSDCFTYSNDFWPEKNHASPEWFISATHRVEGWLWQTYLDHSRWWNCLGLPFRDHKYRTDHDRLPLLLITGSRLAPQQAKTVSTTRQLVFTNCILIYLTNYTWEFIKHQSKWQSLKNASCGQELEMQRFPRHTVIDLNQKRAWHLIT